MSIQTTVGEGGANAPADVITVQLLLNLNRPGDAPALVVDGNAGEATVAAIRAFQAALPGIGEPDGRVDPAGRTFSALAKKLPAFDHANPLTAWRLKGVMPLAAWHKIELYLAGLQAGMARRAINTPLRQAHFLAQLCHESGYLRYAEEIASGEAYEGRADLGNTQPGDGRRFKGRGLIQLTGRHNYNAYGADIGRNLTEGSNPELVAKDPNLAVDVACWFWNKRDLNAQADADKLARITEIINGGLNGLSDREAILRRAKFFYRLS